MNEGATLALHEKDVFPSAQLIHVLQPIIAGFSRPMWVKPLLHKASSNDSVCFAAGDGFNGAHDDFHFRAGPICIARPEERLQTQSEYRGRTWGCDSIVSCRVTNCIFHISSQIKKNFNAHKQNKHKGSDGDMLESLFKTFLNTVILLV